ncbi:uncharacterized protein BCR38DRAFT_447553 [Pseudomassariella vexata]|uniref:Uncharacterized protein n=1 Tax=Pseudomassariella vexata TaxID=1141098 RepID=A0A1Y2DGZ4_9PEZI|nr:uncharacterized protein BCR38DRAFT_447553 [Pseudomassariella vexata]ORY58528.1 hypothetical protein BCR38DRAFT_447553 [Pseudomassariella vexata]
MSFHMNDFLLILSSLRPFTSSSDITRMPTRDDLRYITQHFGKEREVREQSNPTPNHVIIPTSAKLASGPCIQGNATWNSVRQVGESAARH